MKGFEWNPKSKSSSSVTSSSHYEKQLENKVEKMEADVVSLRKENITLKSQMSGREEKLAKL